MKKSRMEPATLSGSTVPWIRVGDGAVIVRVHVLPRARRNEIDGVYGEALKIRLTAPPVEGMANKALTKFLADILDIGHAQVDILAGQTGRQKVVRIRGVDARVVEAVIRTAISGHAG